MQVRRQAAQLKGAQRAAMAANGLDLNEGTAAELQDQTDFFGATDAATTRTNARKQAWQYRQQGNAYGAQANSAMPNAYMEAGGTILSGASKVASSWYKS